MYAPHTVTLYYSVEDKVTFKETFFVTVLHGVFFDAAKASNLRSSGLENADSVNLYIPFGVKAVDGATGEEKTFASPKVFGAMEDKSAHWTITSGSNCFFVKGEVVELGKDYQYINTNYDDVYRVTKVDEKDFGSKELWHWEVGGA